MGCELQRAKSESALGAARRRWVADDRSCGPQRHEWADASLLLGHARSGCGTVHRGGPGPAAPAGTPSARCAPGRGDTHLPGARVPPVRGVRSGGAGRLPGSGGGEHGCGGRRRPWMGSTGPPLPAAGSLAGALLLSFFSSMCMNRVGPLSVQMNRLEYDPDKKNRFDSSNSDSAPYSRI